MLKQERAFPNCWEAQNHEKQPQIKGCPDNFGHRAYVQVSELDRLVTLLTMKTQLGKCEKLAG
uniref:Uncharacterized protein n=1 Tax=Anguilla anguilla TaxID=7936 RepID=A0A0E9SNL7_ANGAN